MTAPYAFPSFLCLTIVLLGGVVFTGVRAKRKAHFTLVACALASLGTSIYWAEKLGDLYDLTASGWVYPVHITLAKITVFAYLLPIATGLATIKVPRVRRLHGWMAFFVLTLTVATAVLGTAMILLAERI